MADVRANVKINIEIKGVEEISGLIEKHYELLSELEKNLNKIQVARVELEANINQQESKG